MIDDIMETKKLALLLIAICLLSTTATIYLYSKTFFVEYNAVYAEVEIGRSPGVNGDRSALMFGRIINASSSAKKITITNSRESEVRVEIGARGSIAPLLGFQEITTIPPGEKESITITAYDKQMPLGNYSGEVLFKISGRKSPFSD